MQSIKEILYLYEDDVVEMKQGGRIGFDNGGEVEKLADNFVKQEKFLGRSVDDQLRKEYIDALKKQTSPVQTNTYKYPFKFLNQRTGEIETVYKVEPTDYSKRSKRVSTKIDTYADALTDFNAAIRNAFIKNDASLFPKPFAQFLKDRGLKDGTYAHLVKTKQIPSINTDISDFRFKFANRLIDDANKGLKFIDAGTLFKNAGFTDKDVKKVYSLKNKKLNKLDKAEDKIRKAYIRYFQNPTAQNLPVKTFFNPRVILAGATGLTETTVSKKFDIQKFDPEGFETFKRLGNADIQKILLKNFDPATTTLTNPNAFTLGAIKEKINADIKAGNKPFSFYMDTAQTKAANLRKERLTKARAKAGKGVVDILEGQEEAIELLNKFYKENPQELLNNTKLRNILDLKLEDGEIVKKNKYVKDKDFLELIKKKSGLFTKDHVDEVQFEKLSTEFPVFRQLATYNTNSGLIKSIKAYVAKNQNSKDPVVQNKIKKQIEFLEDLKLRIDTPMGRVGSKEVLAAVDRKAGTLPNFLAQLRALNIKLPPKAKAAILGISGGLGATTLAAAGPIEETRTKSILPEVAGGAAAGSLAFKPVRQAVGKGLKATGRLLSKLAVPIGLGAEAYFAKQAYDEGKSIPEIMAAPFLLEGKVRQTQDMLSMSPEERQAVNRASREDDISGLSSDFDTPRLEGVDEVDIEEVLKRVQRKRMADEARRIEERKAGGGIAGIRRPDAIPPESGPNPQGLENLKYYVTNT